MKISLSACVLLFYSSIVSSITLSVNLDGTGDYTSLQDAVNAIAALPDTTPKFSPGTSEACFFGSGSSLSTRVVANISPTSWTTDVSPGDLIALNGTDIWYEVTAVINDGALDISRPDEGSAFRCGAYTVVEMNYINLSPGVYSQETLDMTDVHFVTFRGTSLRGASVIEGNDGIDYPTDTTSLLDSIGANPAIAGFPDFFVVKFESLSIHHKEGHAGIVLGEGTPDRVLEFRDVELYAYCCDMVYGQPGHLLIEDSYFSGWFDGVLAGLGSGPYKSPTIKSVTMRNSKIIMSPQNYVGSFRAENCFNYSVMYDSLIEDSELSCQNYASAFLLHRTGSAVFTIRNSTITTVGKSGVAVDTWGPPLETAEVNLVLDNVILESDSVGGLDIRIGTSDTTVTVKCTSTGNPATDPLAVENNNGGTYIVNACN